jgi:hypothetical protein
MIPAHRPTRLATIDAEPYLSLHSDALSEARQLAADHEASGIRTFDQWLIEHDILCIDGPLGPDCLGLAMQVGRAVGVALSTAVGDAAWRNDVVFHELGHLLTGTARSVLCRPDDWLSSRLERLAWCAAAVYSVSAFEAVQIGWNVASPEAIAELHELPVELVYLRYSLGVRDREIPLLRLSGTTMVERALRRLTARCRMLIVTAETDRISP